MADELKLSVNQYDSVIFSWKSATDNVGVTSYKIYRNQIQIGQVEAIDTIYMDFGVAPNSTYTYSVSAGDAVGNWSEPQTLSTKTPSAPAPTPISSASSSSVTIADTSPPTAPTSAFQISATSTKVDIGWNAARDDIGVTAYNIYRNSVLLGTSAASTLQFSDLTATAGQVYIYSIKARDAAGNWSPEQSVTISTPSPLTNSDTTIYWQAPTAREDNTPLPPHEIKGYRIRYKNELSENYSTLELLGNSATSYTFQNLLGSFQFEIAVFDNNYIQSDFAPLTPK